MLGKVVRRLALLRGGGSALPGLFVEKIDPGFIKRTLRDLPMGVVVVSGTNGKTTTTKMVVELLKSQGLTVFTNRTGSNFTRGVAAALLGEVDRKGQLDADIAVLELDEAHAVHFVKAIPPKYSLLLNVMRDQLDRFGEIDATAKMLATVAEATTDTVVLNRQDPRLASIAPSLHGIKVVYFGLSSELTKLFPSDDDMRTAGVPTTTASLPAADVQLQAVAEPSVRYMIGSQPVDIQMKLKGIYNLYNAAGALALVRQIIGPSLNQDRLLAALSRMTPAFGRGETLTIGGQPLEIVLVKNPSGFRLSLASFLPDGYKTMIAINDNYADGRDMSWLWDVDFESLKKDGVAEVSGSRAYDMALRLQYDDVTISHVEPDLSAALAHFVANNAGLPKRIYCTYTAMLAARRQLAKMTRVELVT